jgi:hypothetical protein
LVDLVKQAPNFVPPNPVFKKGRKKKKKKLARPRKTVKKLTEPHYDETSASLDQMRRKKQRGR